MSRNLTAKALNRSVSTDVGQTEATLQGTPQAMAYRRDKAVPKRAHVPLYVYDPAKAGPNVGDQVAVMHSSNSDSGGYAKLVRGSLEIRTVTAVYMADSKGYSIKDHVGDQWLVKPASKGPAKWETFIAPRG
jgi:hypothetical protein